VHSIASTFLIALAALSAGCATLPPPGERTTTSALPESATASTTLGRALAAGVAANPGKTGIHPVPGPRDAFAARVVLAAAAEKSLDVQYYIFHGDQSGWLLLEALWDAAERGVRVRLLLDDLNTAGLDPTIATFDAHPNIEVRLYNPLTQRSVRLMNFVTDFARVNRRMHNKSFTADNQIAVVGGRNVGNEYFGVGDGVVFADLDVIAVGAVVREVSEEFDTYWSSPSAYPAARFVGPGTADGVAALKAKFEATRADPASVVYVEAVRSTPLVRDVIARRMAFEWTTARVFHDDPAKTLDTAGRTDVLLFPELMRAMGRPATSLDLISPYFVPGEEGTQALAALARSGVKVRILTNSLASSDVTAVHAGYAKRRADLLRAGVQLFELKPTAAEGARQDRDLGGSSSAGLHAKTFATDRSRIFVGSFNFDQRSARLNTEMGLVIDSPRLATDLADAFDKHVPRAAWEVRLRTDGSGGLEWIERTAGGEQRHDTEPGASAAKRMGVQFLSILPIEGLL
jgi:putative cardiolipin synthase